MTFIHRLLLAAMAAVCGVIVLVFATGTAHAETHKVLVFRLTGTIPARVGDGDKALTRLTEVVARSAGLTGAEVTIGQVSFDDASALAGCATPDAACLEQIAQVLHVENVVLGVVEPAADDEHVKVSLTAYVNHEVTQRSFTLPAKDVDTMVARLAQEVPSLFVGASPAEPAPEPSPEPVAKPAPPPPPRVVVVPPPTPRDTGFARVSPGAWWLAGGGVVVLGAGVVLSAMAQSKQDEVDKAPVGSVQDFEHLQDLEDEGQQLTLIGDGLLIGGGAVLLAGTAMILYQGLSSPAHEPPSRVSFYPTVLRSGAGLTIEVSLP